MQEATVRFVIVNENINFHEAKTSFIPRIGERVNWGRGDNFKVVDVEYTEVSAMPPNTEANVHLERIKE